MTLKIFSDMLQDDLELFVQTLKSGRAIHSRQSTAINNFCTGNKGPNLKDRFKHHLKMHLKIIIQNFS